MLAAKDTRSTKRITEDSDWKSFCAFYAFLWLMFSTADENDNPRNQQPKIPQRGLDPQLTANDVSETAALQRLPVEDVNVIESEGAEPDQQQG